MKKIIKSGRSFYIVILLLCMGIILVRISNTPKVVGEVIERTNGTGLYFSPSPNTTVWKYLPIWVQPVEDHFIGFIQIHPDRELRSLKRIKNQGFHILTGTDLQFLDDFRYDRSTWSVWQGKGATGEGFWLDISHNHRDNFREEPKRGFMVVVRFTPEQVEKYVKPFLARKSKQ